MASDFTVIQAVRQRFGANDLASYNGERHIDWDSPFVGLSKEFPFACPNIDAQQWAVLQFESVGVNVGAFGTANPLPWNPDTNIIRINGTDVPGGIKAGPHVVFDNKAFPLWKSHSLLVAGRTLREQNVLRIESVGIGFGGKDGFIIDNVVMFYKTRVQQGANTVANSPQTP